MAEAHLRIAHTISEQMMVSDFTEQQRRILDLILRLSWGCGKDSALIPRQKDFEVVGVREGHVKGHLDFLVNAKVIIRENKEYAFNRNYDQWRVTRSVGYTPEKFKELVKMNLNGTYEKCKNGDKKITENVSEKLRNTEETAYGIRKNSTPELASPKEILKKYIYFN